MIFFSNCLRINRVIVYALGTLFLKLANFLRKYSKILMAAHNPNKTKKSVISIPSNTASVKYAVSKRVNINYDHLFTAGIVPD